ncbi:YqcI/YcgG family protein [Comamonas sp. GB3 AK4-5]|uniref:YqcI/YcgG family protein n=1 Tax=Comamonas sp. GB3 AK4-5 TaxID=3231487 RepID=UPI00351E17DA
MNTNRPLTNADMRDPSLIAPWAIDEFDIFHKKVTHSSFPCYFGTVGVKKDEMRYGVINRDALHELPAKLNEFMQFAREHADVRHAYITFFEPEKEEHDFDHYQKRFWEIVNYLHQHDPLPWPAHVTEDTENPNWEFCFSGDDIFLFCGFPAYKQRNSRRFGKSMMILFQPKRVFIGIEGATPGGIQARKIIRPKLQAYDGDMEMHPDFNVIDETLAFRWKQYCASDDNSPATGRCPFSGAKQPPQKASAGSSMSAASADKPM